MRLLILAAVISTALSTALAQDFVDQANAGIGKDRFSGSNFGGDGSASGKTKKRTDNDLSFTNWEDDGTKGLAGAASRGNQVKGMNIPDRDRSSARDTVEAHSQGNNVGVAKGTDKNGNRNSGVVINTGDKVRLNSKHNRDSAKGIANNNNGNSGFSGEGLNAQVNGDVDTDTKQTGGIEVQGVPVDGPFFYEVGCPGGRRSSGRDCTKSYLTNRRDFTRECETVSARQTVCYFTAAKNPFSSVSADTDVDGHTSVSLRGVQSQDAKCKEISRDVFKCDAASGILNSQTEDLTSSSGSPCYSPARPGDPEIIISNVDYKHESDGPNYAFPDCGLMSAYLQYKNFQGDLSDVVRRTAIQFHVNVNPVGKFVCEDNRQCDLLGEQTECYYCDLCKDREGSSSRRSAKAEAMEFSDPDENSELPCDVDGSRTRKVKFVARVCPPSRDVNMQICPRFTKTANSGYWKKNGDIDTRVEAYLREPGFRTKTRKQVNQEAAEFAKKVTSSNFLERLSVAGEQASLLTKYGVTNPRLSGSINLSEAEWLMVKRADLESAQKGSLVGCDTFYGKYGLSASGLLDAVAGGGKAYFGKKPCPDVLKAKAADIKGSRFL